MHTDTVTSKGQNVMSRLKHLQILREYPFMSRRNTHTVAAGVEVEAKAATELVYACYSSGSARLVRLQRQRRRRGGSAGIDREGRARVRTPGSLCGLNTLT